MQGSVWRASGEGVKTRLERGSSSLFSSLLSSLSLRSSFLSFFSFFSFLFSFLSCLCSVFSESRPLLFSLLFSRLFSRLFSLDFFAEAIAASLIDCSASRWGLSSCRQWQNFSQIRDVNVAFSPLRSLLRWFPSGRWCAVKQSGRITVGGRGSGAW